MHNDVSLAWHVNIDLLHRHFSSHGSKRTGDEGEAEGEEVVNSYGVMES